MFCLARQTLSRQVSGMTYSKFRSKKQQIIPRFYCDEVKTPDVIKEKKTQLMTKEEQEEAEISEILNMIEENESKDGIVDYMAEEPKMRFFTDEEKEIMKKGDQRMPYMVETESGVFSYENAVRPLIPFPDPTYANLHTHEDVREYSLGYPVIRPPSIRDRLVQGFSIRDPDTRTYPWIQQFRSSYDILIIGGGVVGSCIANFLAERIKVTEGFKIGVVEKDPTYRKSLSTQFLGGLRTQFSSPELVEAALFGSDFLRLSSVRSGVPADQEEMSGWFNVPNVKLCPHGNLTLVAENNLDKLVNAHEVQKLCGAQTAMLTPRNLEKRFPWLNTNGIAGGCLGLESEGWFDTWNLLQSLILRNKYLGVDYIHGEMMFAKKHAYQKVDSKEFRNYEAHIFVGETKHVYPIEFSSLYVTAGAQSGNVGRMLGFGTGRGPMYMDIPVEPRRVYVFEVKSSDPPGLNFPIVSDPSGLFIRRDGYLGHFLVGLLPTNDLDDKVPEGIHGGVDPDYFDNVVRPLLEYRFPGFKGCTVLESRPVDLDLNYVDGTPVVGPHPLHKNIIMATGFNGRGSMFGPAVGRALAELELDKGYKTVDFSRFSFDRYFHFLETKENLYA